MLFFRVRHLILADPWGFSDVPPDYKPPMKFRVLRVLLFPLFYMNPLASVRAAGPLGKSSFTNLYLFECW